MAAFKKLFQGDRSSSRPPTSPGFAADEPYFGSVEAPTPDKLELSQLSPGLPSPGFPSPGLNASRSLDVAHHFEQIEKQFEHLHEHLATRPLSGQSQLSPALHGRFLAPKKPNSRHIDLMDALFSSEKHQEPAVQPASPPASPYNEDVADRNMTRFMRVQHRNGHTGSRILSALYQEDVADRNIAKYGGPSRSLSALSCRSSPAAPGRVRNLSPHAQPRDVRKRSAGMPNWTSDGDLRNRSTSAQDSLSASHASNYLRQQRSEPSFSPDDDYDAAQEEAIPAPIQRLGVPPAYKVGDRWSNTPLPDSPTLPAPPGSSGNSGNGTSKPASSPAPLQPSIRSSSLTPQSQSPPPSAGSVSSTSRKNKRDLSINVQLASSGRPKIVHRAIQPPTPSAYEMKRAPSIAEVMNSPLPAPSPTQPSPRFKASEMMDLFNKAYMSTKAVSPHPTYESLQDAIVREINSHEAFQRVPPPTVGPPFTPSPGRANFDGFKPAQPELNRSSSAGQFSKIMRKSSFRKHKRNSESRRSISSIPSKGYDKILRRVAPDPSPRRHTDAPPPTPGFLVDIDQSKRKGAPHAGPGEPLTYMDVLSRSGNDKALTPAARRRGHSESATNIAAMANAVPEFPDTPRAVYCMQAHSTPSRDSRSSGSHEESDDDILHLPSVAAPPPRVQIEGVDENNVRYMIDSDTATNAQKLMSWPQRLRRGNSPQPTSAPSMTSLSPLSRARMQLRGARSVETY
ncbi:hypothetical protein N7492_006256 [Penicillium capsulatum]|uniref:Uncharacterized protein n=1 Tax=Penicillium capsulatum TaxID=69766 RepID=A0A9W9I135_9EURO|nr:hypothetical protein N7492_006256 [Penicillium capsulatum]KAJ6108908.1 hypothetical protein N7512_008745 [Penicillium capsulatum]